jgi:hypothetical protein
MHLIRRRAADNNVVCGSEKSGYTLRRGQRCKLWYLLDSQKPIAKRPALVFSHSLKTNFSVAYCSTP